MEPEEIFNTYYNRLYSFTLFRVQSVHDAEDITSDVFLKAVKNYWRFNEKKASMTTWLFTIAINEIRTYYRKRRNFLPLEHTDDIASAENALDGVLANERSRELYDAIASLDERQRSIILLRYYGEMTNKQIARVLKLTETNVETILSRSKKILKKYLEKCEVSSSHAYKEMEVSEKEASNAR